NNSMFGMLERIPNQTAWSEYESGKEFCLSDAQGQNSGLRCRAWSLSEHYPAYVSKERRVQLAVGEASMGLILQSASGARVAYMPAVPELNDALLDQFEKCDVLLFDGTFWSDDELIRLQGSEQISPQTALQMGHIPVETILTRLAGVERPRKIFLHINNTNPMLNQASDEYRQVRGAGWEIAEDGWQFNV
ncbi:MAG: MBL fold metallo-hydrolase, partial [Candidatus Sulfotelmatobacter sp.]